MQKRWAHSKKTGFTLVELIIVIAVIGLLAAISIIAYNNVQKNTADKTLRSDLDNVTSEMQREALQNNGIYPTALPSGIKSSPNVTLTLEHSGGINYYGYGAGLTPIQNGVLMAQICQDLINEGYGQGQNQDGDTEDYITGCGNWNSSNMQFTGWKTKKFFTPVTDATLLNYADTFTTTDTFNKNQETVVKNFYHELVYRQTRQGGSFPLTSFWDSWATPQNGGVAAEPLPSPQVQPSYCVEATHSKYPDLLWHVTDELKIETGGC